MVSSSGGVIRLLAPSNVGNAAAAHHRPHDSVGACETGASRQGLVKQGLWTLGRVGRSEEGGSRPATVLMTSTAASGPGKAPWWIGVSQARSAGHPRQVCASGSREGGFGLTSRLGSLFEYVTLSVRRGRTRRGLGAANPPQAVRSAPTQRSRRD